MSHAFVEIFVTISFVENLAQDELKIRQNFPLE
jgi:hypothetical protein